MKKGSMKKLAIGAVAAFALGGIATTVASTNGIALETSGIKISLDLKSPAGAKVIFQRAD